MRLRETGKLVLSLSATPPKPRAAPLTASAKFDLRLQGADARQQISAQHLLMLRTPTYASSD